MAEQETMRLSVLEETGSSLCVASNDGHMAKRYYRDKAAFAQAIREVEDDY